MAEPLRVRTHALLLGSGFIFASGALLGLSLPMRAELEGFPTCLIGFIGSTFAASFVADCLLVPRLVAKVGHVRVFGVMAALVAVTDLVNILFIHPFAWIVVRAVTGFAVAPPVEASEHAYVALEPMQSATQEAMYLDP